MDAYLFICLGTRDVQIENSINLEGDLHKTLEECKYPWKEKDKNFRGLNVRKLGHWLYDNFDKVKEIIRIPLSEPFLNHIENESHTIKQIYLIATDQQKTIEESAKEHLERDTCIIADFLKEKFFPYFFTKKRCLPFPI
ncbi:MAG: hypothetical protein ACP5UA_12150 [Candidatus Hydrogenedens sp.]